MIHVPPRRLRFYGVETTSPNSAPSLNTDLEIGGTDEREDDSGQERMPLQRFTEPSAPRLLPSCRPCLFLSRISAPPFLYGERLALHCQEPRSVESDVPISAPSSRLRADLRGILPADPAAVLGSSAVAHGGEKRVRAVRGA